MGNMGIAAIETSMKKKMTYIIMLKILFFLNIFIFASRVLLRYSSPVIGHN
jgi:hypothetical protein